MEDYTNLNLVLKSGYTVDEDEPIAAIKVRIRSTFSTAI